MRSSCRSQPAIRFQLALFWSTNLRSPSASFPPSPRLRRVAPKRPEKAGGEGGRSLRTGLGFSAQRAVALAMLEYGELPAPLDANIR